MTIALRPLSLAFVFAVASSAALRAQDPPPPPKDPDEVVKAAKKDTYTNGDEKAMKALGVVAYGPLMWSDNMRTPTIEKVLGEGRIMWMETEHFLLGTNLASIGIPQNPDARKAVNAELGRLKKKWSKMPDRATKLDPWLRAHLFALRCEELYEDFAKLTAHDPKSGTFLGQPGKFSVLLFQKKSDLVRYVDAFCGRKHDGPIRHLYPKSSTNGVVLSAEGEDPYEDPSLQRLFRFNLVQAFVDARGGAPYWLSAGLAHWYARQIEANIMTCAVRDGESVDEHTQNEWEDKIKARAPRESLCTPLVKLFAETELGYYGHLQAWSHVDHLLALDRTKFGEFFTNVKAGATPALQEQLLQQLYGMDAATCDAKWREWAVKAYK